MLELIILLISSNFFMERYYKNLLLSYAFSLCRFYCIS